MSYTRAVFVGLLIGLLLNGLLWLVFGYDGLIHPPWWTGVPIGLVLAFACLAADGRRRADH